MPRKPSMSTWSYTEPNGKVTVEERITRNRTLYLWWHEDGNWKKKSLGRKCRGERGALDPDSVAWAKGQAERKAAELKLNVTHSNGSKPHRLTLGETQDVLTDKQRGKYPHDSEHRREILRALRHAIATLGSDKTWDSFDVDDYRAVWRGRIQAGLKQTKETHSVAKGHGSAVATVKAIVAIASALRQAKRIEHGSAHPPPKWREQIAEDWQGFAGSDRPPEKFQPRHTQEEMIALLKVCDAVDPRFGLLLQLGAELRLGQVCRSRRSDLKLDDNLFESPRAGKKKGAVVDMTEGQRAAVDRALSTWLQTFERRYQAEGVDYYLFPTGRPVRWLGVNWNPAALDPSKHVSQNWVLDHFHLCEDAAGVRRIRGRGAYGVKRQSVDMAMEGGISEDALQALGGWSSSRMPREVYRDQKTLHGAKEAKKHRARIRGEAAKQ